MTAVLLLTLLLDLEPYRWKNRILLQFGGSPPPLALPEGFVERDLVWLEAKEEALRKRFRITKTPVWILIGKDGGEKARWTKPPKPEELFRKIDAMPMRQSEMRKP